MVLEASENIIHSATGVLILSLMLGSKTGYVIAKGSALKCSLSIV